MLIGTACGGMTMNTSAWTGLALAGAMLIAGVGGAKALDTSEVLVTQLKLNQTVSNVAVAIPVDVYLFAEFGLETPKIHIRATASLADLQQKFQQIIQQADLPKDNCKSYSPENPVVSVSNASLTYANGSANAHVEGSAVIWSCLQNPVPNSKVEWQMKKIGPIETNVPVVVTWPGDPIKAILGTQPFTIDLPVGVRRADDKSLAVDLGEAKADLGGQYADITKAILGILQVDINKVLNDAIHSALDPKALVADLPKDITDAGFVLESAQFTQAQSSLAVEAHASLTLTTDNAKATAKLLYDEIMSKVTTK
jgi:hypothetical protein